MTSWLVSPTGGGFGHAVRTVGVYLCPCRNGSVYLKCPRPAVWLGKLTNSLLDVQEETPSNRRWTTSASPQGGGLNNRHDEAEREVNEMHALASQSVDGDAVWERRYQEIRSRLGGLTQDLMKATHQLMLENAFRCPDRGTLGSASSSRALEGFVSEFVCDLNVVLQTIESGYAVLATLNNGDCARQQLVIGHGYRAVEQARVLLNRLLWIATRLGRSRKPNDGMEILAPVSRVDSREPAADPGESGAPSSFEWPIS